MADPSVIAQVRALIADLGDPPLLSDDQLAALLALNADAPLMAAAQALEVIAVSEVLVSKKIRTQDLTTDGPAVSAELRALAKTYRQQHADVLAASDAFDGFDLVGGVGGTCDRPELTPWSRVTGM